MAWVGGFKSGRDIKKQGPKTLCFLAKYFSNKPKHVRVFQPAQLGDPFINLVFASLLQSDGMNHATAKAVGIRTGTIAEFDGLDPVKG